MRACGNENVWCPVPTLVETKTLFAKTLFRFENFFFLFVRFSQHKMIIFSNFLKILGRKNPNFSAPPVSLCLTCGIYQTADMFRYAIFTSPCLPYFYIYLPPRPLPISLPLPLSPSSTSFPPPPYFPSPLLFLFIFSPYHIPESFRFF